MRAIVKKRWDANPDVPWLEPDELKADAFRDLPTSDGLLSIWEIPEASDAERVAIALAATRDSPGDFDYVMFEGSLLQPPAFALKQNSGETPDEGINDWHHDVELLTTRKLADLAQIISKGYKNEYLKRRCKKSS